MALDDERDLIERFRKGDLSIFGVLVLRYQDRIYHVCRSMLGDVHDAEDAAQDVFVSAYRKLGGFRSESSLSTWLYRIAVNTCLDYRKKRRPEPFEDASFSENLPSCAPSPERLCDSKETGRLIEAALRRLPQKLRAAIVLKEVEGLSYEEIAVVLRTSLGTVKSRISRAREDLRLFLQNIL